MRQLLSALVLLSALSVAHGADAPTATQIEARLELLTLKRQKLFSDYRAGELLMRNAQLEDVPLKTEEDALKARLDELRKPAVAVKAK